MSKKRILVCGATGFIGRNIAERLSLRKDFEVIGVYCKSKPYNYPEIKMVKADLTNKKDVNKVAAGTDILIQAAASTSGAHDIVNRPYHHVTDNAVMNSLILRAAFEYNVPRFIFFSCTVMYQPSQVPVKESDFDAGEEIFKAYFGAGWTKVYIEKMCEFYSRLKATKFCILRHSNIYGPHDKFDLEKSHVFGATVAKVLTAKDDKISVWGKGKTGRDFLYISDLLDCIELIVDKCDEPFALYNVGCGKTVSVHELVEKIIRYSKRDLRIEFDTSKPDIKTSLCLDCSKIRKVLCWKPKVNLDEGIKKTIDWYKDNIVNKQ